MKDYTNSPPLNVKEIDEVIGSIKEIPTSTIEQEEEISTLAPENQKLYVASLRSSGCQERGVIQSSLCGFREYYPFLWRRK